MDSLQQVATPVAATVDWLSFSAGGSGAGARLLEWRDQRFAVLGTEGHIEKQYGSHGYQYRQRGAVSIGVGSRHVLCQLSGSEAELSWRDLAGLAENVSRIDLAVTARTGDGTDSLARENYAVAQSRPRGRGKPTQLTLIQGEDRGDTLYVGARASDVRGRLYDKWRESGDDAYRDCWRWEVQYRRGYAMSALRSLTTSSDARSSITATVASWFSSRGVRAAFGVDGDPLATGDSRAASDDERWLKWARRCVQPRARELAVRYGWRYVAEACVGRISTFEEWESLVSSVEAEMVAVED
jgi:DNA relaxase NicK